VLSHSQKLQFYTFLLLSSYKDSATACQKTSKSGETIWMFGTGQLFYKFKISPP
jgi:hypothetical protein